MADSKTPPSSSDDDNPALPPEDEGLGKTVASFSQHDRSKSATLFQAFFNFAGSSQGRRQISQDVLSAVVEFEGKREQNTQTRSLRIINWLGLLALALLGTLLALVFLVRDHVELVKAVFEGTALLVSHGIIGTSGYLIGKHQNSVRRR